MPEFNGLMTNLSSTYVDGKPLIMDRKERIRRFGIDCAGPHGDGIVFRGGEWTVGGEYIQKLTVKNVSTKMRKLKYKLPFTQYFTMNYPERIDLSPGMHVEIDVVFRPVKLEVYDDTIYFKIAEHSDSGGFHVPVRALISTLQVSVPRGLDFGLCPTNEITRYAFEVRNTGQVPAPFEWSCPAPFRLTPMSGVVPVGGAVEMEATIVPEDASVFVSQAVCEVGNGVNAIKPFPVVDMRLSAIGKYTHITPSEDKLNFGVLHIGTTEDTTKDVVIRNHSLVPATVLCQRVEDDREPVFTLSPMEFVIPPQGETRLDVRYEPCTAGMFTLEHFRFITPGGNATTIACSGQATGPAVRLYKKEDPFAMGHGVSNSVNFRDVQVGETAHRALFLKNDSALPARFQFILQDHGCFRLSRYQGEIPAGLETSVRVDFTPTNPTNYYQRLFVLVEHAMPLFFDVMGTAFIPPRGEVKEQRPAPLRHAHVQAYRNRCAVGLAQASPLQLEEVLEREGMGPLFAAKGPHGTQLLATSAVDRPVARSGDTTRNQVAVANEFLRQPTSAEVQPVFLTTEQVDFGYVAVGGLGDKRSLALTNTTGGKVGVQWVIKEGMAFDVVPREADINPGKVMDFKLVFRPSQQNCYYCEELEVYTFFKNQRTFRLVQDPLLQPPWCCKVKGVGHTLPHEHFAAQVSVVSRGGLVEFTGCHIGDSTYQTVRLNNNSNLPAFFQCNEDPTNIFAAKPRSGIIQPHSFQLLLVRFAPKSTTSYDFTLETVINHDLTAVKTVRLVGEGSVPRVNVVEVDELRNQLRLPPEASPPHLYMRPTCLGLASSREVTVRNPSRIPALFQVDMPPRLEGVFSITPRSGLLRGNQSVALTVGFAPREQKEYKLKFRVSVRALAGRPPDFGDSRLIGEAEAARVVATQEVVVVAAGGGAVLTFDPPDLDFGTLLVNDATDLRVTLVNNADCDIQYELVHSVSQGAKSGEQEGRGHEELVPVKSHGEAETLLMDCPTGILPSRSRTIVKATFHPLDATGFDIRVAAKVRAVDQSGKPIAQPSEEAALLRVGNRERLAAILLHDGPQEDVDGETGPGPLPLSAQFRGSATFPNVIVRDARLAGGGLGGSTDQLWHSLGLHALNSALSQPLTPAEVRLNLESSPDRSTLVVYPFKFPPCPIGSQRAVLCIELKNPGFLTTAFEIHFPNESEIEIPQWADEGEPTKEQLKQNRIIDELKCFQVYPRSGTLESGKSTVVTFTYSYTSLDFNGCHSLPLLVKVSQGKQFYIRLEGTTLESSAALLWRATPPQREVQFLRPVAIGTTLAQAPVQTTELLNMGEADLQYEVNVTPLQGIMAAYGFQTLYLENPVGRVPGRSRHLLRWRFLPLEAVDYKYDLTITWKGGAVSPEPHPNVKEPLVIVASGYDPRDHDPYQVALPTVDQGLLPPPHQLLQIPALQQPALLSQERLFLGRLPQRCVRHELIVLRNTNTSAAIEFIWDMSHPLLANQLVRIEPPSGRIPPGGFASVKVVVTANVRPCIVSDQVSVEVKTVAVQEGRRRNNQSRLESRLAKTGGSRVGTAARESIVSRSTRSRDQHLRSTMLPDGRVPGLPSTLQDVLGAPPHPHSSVGAAGSVAGSAAVAPPRSAGTPAHSIAGSEAIGEALDDRVQLYLSLWFEVVEEDAFVHSFGGDLSTHNIPLPRVFVPPDREEEQPEGFSEDLMSPRSTQSVVSYPAETDVGRQCQAAKVVGGIFAELFSDILDGHEVRETMEALPQVPLIPLYADMRDKTSLLVRLQQSFTDFDVDSSGKLSMSEIRAGLRHLGFKARTAQVKVFLRSMDANKDGEVDLKEFLTNCPGEVQLAIEEALSEKEHEARLKAKEARQQQMAMVGDKKMVPEEEVKTEAGNAASAATPPPGDDVDRAAVKIQGRMRSRKAKKDVEYKRFLATEEGKDQHEAAIKMQGLERTKQARKQAQEKREQKKYFQRQEAIAQPAFQNLIMDILESTMSNILEEALEGEFDLNTAVKQYAIGQAPAGARGGGASGV